MRTTDLHREQLETVMVRGGFYTGDGGVSVGDTQRIVPGPRDVEMAVSHVGICGTDLHVLHGTMDHRVSLPQLIGHEMSGVVTDIGEEVEGLQMGDKVVVRPLVSCGECPACAAGHSHICQRLTFLGIDAPGALQDSWTVPADIVHRVPDAVSLQHAALVEPLAVACHDVRRATLEPGESVVVFGAGPIGLLIALLARHNGCPVLITDVNAARLAFAAGLGLDTAAPADLDAEAANRDGEKAADVVFEVSGSRAAIAQATGLLRTRGRLVIVGIHSEPHEVDLFRVFWRELVIVGARVYEPDDFDEAIALVDAGALPIDRLISSVMPLDDLAEAFSLLQSGDGVKVLIDLSLGR